MTIYFSASWLPSLTQHSSVRTRLSCTNTPVKSHTDLMTITDHCITIPCSACTLPPSGDESRSSSCPSSERWKGAMSAEGRPVKRWSLTEGGGEDSATSANRGFLSCHGDLELDRALSLYAALFHCMDDFAFKYHSSQSGGNQPHCLTCKSSPAQCGHCWDL